MILESRFAPYASKKSLLAIALLALLVLPSFVESTQTEARADANDQPANASAAVPAAAPAATPETPMAAELPYRVPFQQGAIRFADGDEITILEVRGTADTFTRGNIYCVKGTYTLASREQAILLASATVNDPGRGGLGLNDLRVRSDFFMPGLGRDPGNATGVELRVQRADVRRGTGAFTLFLPTPFGGFPHVSFCSVESGGASFGGNYFGTGDSVLGQWWDTKRPPAPTTTAEPQAAAAADFSHVVNFEQGATRFLDGDKITILEVRGTADTFIPGNQYQIKGTYSLASHDRATLAAYTTAWDLKDGTSPSLEIQKTIVDVGNGTFTLVLPMLCKGWPHVSFYPADGGDGFGGNYFGTGDSVRKEWRSKGIDRISTGASADRELKLVTIEKAYWKESEDAPIEIRGLKWTLAPGSGCFFIHCQEWLEDAGGYLQYKRFMQQADPNLVLRAEGQPDVTCHISRNFISNRSPDNNLCELEVIIPADECAKLAKDVAYSLHPTNGKGGNEWRVRDGLTLTRQ